MAYVCEWYEVAGQRVRGTYEKHYAETMVGRGVEFVAQPGPPIEWVDGTGKVRKYTPDFFIPGTGEYVEVTSEFALSDRAKREGPKKREKLAAVARLVDLVVLTEKDIFPGGKPPRKGVSS